MSRGRERGYRASKSFVSILSALDTVLCSVFLKAPTLALALTPPIPNFLLSASPLPPNLSLFRFVSPIFFPSFSVFIFFLSSSSSFLPPLFFYSIPLPPRTGINRRIARFRTSRGNIAKRWSGTKIFPSRKNRSEKDANKCGGQTTLTRKFRE